MAFSSTNQPPRSGQELARQGEAPQSRPARRSRLLGGVNSRAVGEAVLVAALLSVVAFWQGDFVSEKLDMYLDTAKGWPVDGVLAVLGGLFMMLSTKVKPINKIRFGAPLATYGANAIYNARMKAGLPVGA